MQKYNRAFFFSLKCAGDEKPTLTDEPKSPPLDPSGKSRQKTSHRTRQQACRADALWSLTLKSEIRLVPRLWFICSHAELKSLSLWDWNLAQMITIGWNYIEMLASHYTHTGIALSLLSQCECNVEQSYIWSSVDMNIYKLHNWPPHMLQHWALMASL